MSEILKHLERLPAPVITGIFGMVGVIVGALLAHLFSMGRQYRDERRRRMDAVRNTGFALKVQRLVLTVFQSGCLEIHRGTAKRHREIDCFPDAEPYTVVPINDMMFFMEKHESVLERIHRAELNYKSVLGSWRLCDEYRRKVQMSRDRLGNVTDTNADEWLEELVDYLYLEVPKSIGQLNDVLVELKSREPRAWTT